MPAQQRPRRHEQRCPRRLRQINGRCGQQCPIGHPKLRSTNLPAQYLELVPQNEQLDVLHVQAAAAPTKRSKQSPKRQIKIRRKPSRRSSQPVRPRTAPQILAPFRQAAIGSDGAREVYPPLFGALNWSSSTRGSRSRPRPCGREELQRAPGTTAGSRGARDCAATLPLDRSRAPVVSGRERGSRWDQLAMMCTL